MELFSSNVLKSQPGHRPIPIPAHPQSQPRSEQYRLEAATEQAIAACGGDARDAVKALIVANEFLEARIEELRADVSKGYAARKKQTRRC